MGLPGAHWVLGSDREEWEMLADPQSLLSVTTLILWEGNVVPYPPPQWGH